MSASTTDDKNDKDVIIRCDNIHKTYLLGVEGVPALRGVSLTINRGEKKSLKRKFFTLFKKASLFASLGRAEAARRRYSMFWARSTSPRAAISTLAGRKVCFLL